jgi:hypothetical protein
MVQRIVREVLMKTSAPDMLTYYRIWIRWDPEYENYVVGAASGASEKIARESSPSTQVHRTIGEAEADYDSRKHIAELAGFKQVKSTIRNDSYALFGF